MKIYIKNMVCNRCIMVVTKELENLNLFPVQTSLGEVTFDRELSESEKKLISKTLQPIGFSIIDDKKSRLIEKIKNSIVELVHQQNGELRVNLSEYLTHKLHHEYNYISSLFSEIEGSTIEKYYIAQKIERVKELLVYDELSLSEISHLLNYSSVSYLSNQFKKITGLSPSHFKTIGENKRRPLDQI